VREKKRTYLFSSRGRREQPAGSWILRGEDLATIGPVALLQDLKKKGDGSFFRPIFSRPHYVNGIAVAPWRYGTHAPRRPRTERVPVSSGLPISRPS
jgi:hypothetical protein